jgi:hypothetical protein
MIDWNPFGPDRPDPPERKGVPKRLERIFHGFMVIVLLGIVFALSGAFVIMEVSRSSFPFTDHTGWIIFAVGGLGGTAFLVKRYFSNLS